MAVKNRLKFIPLEERIVLDGAIAHDVAAAPAASADIHLLVLPDNTPDASTLQAAVKPGVEVVRYDPKDTTLAALGDKITQTLHGQKAADIAFIGEGIAGAFSLICISSSRWVPMLLINVVTDSGSTSHTQPKLFCSI